MKIKIKLSEAQGLALEKLRALVGNEQVDLILAQGPEVIRARLDAFMQFESTLIGQYTTIRYRLCLLGMFPSRQGGSPSCLDCKEI